MNHIVRRVGRLATAVLVCGLVSACGGSGSSTNNNTSDTAVYYSHSLAFLNATTLMSWGYNGFGQLGNNTNTNQSVPVKVQTGAERYTGYAIGSNHTLAFMNNSTVRAWGYNAYGQLGTTPTNLKGSTVPVKVVGVNGATALAGGHNFSLAMANYSSVPRVVGWGRNDRGQLGNNSTADSSSPVRVQQAPGGGPLLGNITRIAVGSDHCLALDAAGIVWAWGSNTFGQLGVASSLALRALADQVTGITGTVIAIAAGGSTSYALTSDGSVWAWGYNGFGQLGASPVTVPSRSTPTKVALVGTVTDIAAGLGHVVALLNDGTLRSWGANIYGQVGAGTIANQQTKENLFYTVPQQVIRSGTPNDFLTGVASLVVVSGNFTVVRMTDTTLRAWGNNFYGQLGNGTTDTSAIPVLVKGF